jgi:hypothetical protein
MSSVENLLLILKHPWLWAKVSGALTGSSIAVVFKPGGDSYSRLIKRVVLGFIIGVLSASRIRILLGWELNFESFLQASAIGGLVGYMLLQLLFSDAVANKIKEKAGKL